MPGKPTVSQDHVRTVQQAGGTPTAAPGGRQVPCKKNITNITIKKKQNYIIENIKGENIKMPARAPKKIKLFSPKVK